MIDRPLITAGILLGVGLGGFLDGIIFHQVFQFHNMLSARIPPDTLVNAKVNMFWDGMFHVFTWTLAALGVYRLWRAGLQRDVMWAGRTLLGAMLIGWGSFNIVEGIVDHYVLRIHHVVEAAGLSIYDHLFVGISVGLVAAGVVLIRRARVAAAPRIMPLGSA